MKGVVGFIKYAFVDDGTEDSGKYIQHDMLYGPPGIRTRYCPGFHGIDLQYIGDGVYANPVTGDVYDFAGGYYESGEFHPGTSVKHQTVEDASFMNDVPHEVLMFKGK